MKDLAVSCTAGHLQNHFTVDLNYFEETANCTSVFLVLQPSLNIVTVLQTFQRQTTGNFEALLDTAMKGCVELYSEMQKALNVRLKQLAIGAGKVEL